MADNVVANAGSGGATFATDDIGGVHYPLTKIALGALDSNGGPVSSANPMPISDAGGSLTVDGTVTANAGSGTFAISNAALSVTGGGVEASALRVTVASDSTGVLSVDDNGASLTVDGTVTANAGSGTFAVSNTVLSVVGGGTEATAQRVTIANDSTGVLSVDDNGGSLTVDGSVSLAAAIPAGANNIGDVDVLTQPARAATTDAITAKLATDAIQNGITALTPKFVFVNVAASQTDSNVITAVASKKLRVLGYQILAGGTATNVTFNSKPAGAGTAISMLHACPANGGLSSGFSPVGFFETVSGEGLTVTTGTGSTVGVQVQYVEV